MLVDTPVLREVTQTGAGTVAPGEGQRGKESQETYHNDVLMLLGSQVCVLRD